MPAAPTTTAELLDLIRKSGILPPERFAAVDVAALPPEPKKAAAALFRDGVLTKFQAQQFLQGRHKGFCLGPYVLHDQIGRGGMGVVYLAEHNELRRKVAIKVLVVGKDNDAKLATERFLREARAVAALDHPNIIRIFDVGRHNDTPYLVTEYVTGETLQQTIDREGAIPYPAAAEAIAQAAAGLQHAHEKGFVHRDVKPGNLMRDRTGTVKLLDMGLARSFANETDHLTEKLDHGAVVGTADYISPEQALNAPRIDIRADIYSLGASFYALVAGKPPFDGNTTQKLLHHQLKTPPALSQLDPSLPKGLAAVAAKMLAKKPADRYQTPADVIAALAPWLEDRSRVMAGISGTNLALGAALHARLHGAGSSGRLPGAVAVEVEDATAVDPSHAAHDTIAEMSSRTGKEPARRKKPVPAPPPVRRKKTLLVAGGILALAAVGGVVAAVALGDRDTPRHAANPSPEPPLPPHTEPPKPDPTPTPKPQPVPPTPQPPAPVPPENREVYRLDLSGQEPFAIRIEQTATRDGKRVSKVLSRAGPGKPPAGWKVQAWKPDSEVEFFADETADGLAIRNVRGMGSAMLFMPKFDCLTGVCRLTLDYSSTTKPAKSLVRFNPADTRKAWDVTRIPPTAAGAWRTETLAVDLRGATGGYFEFHNTDPSPDAVLRVRSVTVTELPAGTPPTYPAKDDTPNPFAGWKEGAVVYALDVAAIPPFRVRKEGGKRLDGDAEKLPAGVQGSFWKPDAVGEFRCETIDGVPALGVTNFTDLMAGQFTLDLEGKLGVPLAPGTAYRVTVGYMTKNDATGAVAVQTTEYKPVATAKLTNTAGGWKTASVAFQREDDVPVRITLDNRSVGEGNTIYFRSITVAELVEPE